MKNLRNIATAALLSLLTSSAWGMRGGEIRWTAIDLYTYQFELHFYERVQWDRPEILLELGNGEEVFVPRVSVDTLEWPCGTTTRNVYIHQHTYGAPGSYTVSMRHSGRLAGVLNIPNAHGQEFCVTSLLVIDPDLGPNNSVQFNNSMTITDRIGNTMYHDPGTTESDGDSLSFSLVEPLGDFCTSIIGYFPLSQIWPEPPNEVTIDQTSGVFVWDRPHLLGSFSVVIEASEWRAGQLIGQVRRDMVLCVTPDYLTSVQEQLEAPPISLHPNPGTTTLQLIGLGPQPAHLRVLDMQGRVVLETNTVMDERPIDASALPAGVYLVDVTTEQGRQVLRWVKE